MKQNEITPIVNTPSQEFWAYLCSDEWEENEWDDWDGGEED